MVSTVWAALAPLVLSPAALPRTQPPDSLPAIAANANRIPAGRLRGGVLTVRLEAREGLWHPEAEDGPGIPVQAFGEKGGPLQNPGPLIRVPEGTEIRATVRNGIAGATLVVHGLHARPGSPADTLVVAPGEVREVRFAAGAPGTYFYWATTTGVPLGERVGRDSQLSAAFIVDPRERGPSPADRVFVIGVWRDSLDLGKGREERRVVSVNGRSFPHTEDLTFTVGDSVGWRWINPSDRGHPMHLHGFYYRVDSRGDAERDTVYGPEAQRLVVTESMRSGSTMAMRWSPDRPGNWIFHCHIIYHVLPDLRLGPSHPEAGAPMRHMAGLVLALHVRPAQEAPAAHADTQRLRLLVQARPGVYAPAPDSGFGYVLQRDTREPAPDSVEIPGPPIVLTRGRPARITVVNRLPEATAVHWHGIELQSYYDGVAGLSGTAGRLMPAIAPGDSFAAIMTPPRAGTFIYHTHLDDLRQLGFGLYGPLLVLEPGRSFDPATDHVVILGIGGISDSAKVLVNGRVAPDPIELRAGAPQRFRLISILPAGRFWMRLLSDSTLLEWRAVAKDGADLPSAQATRQPARVAIDVGETYDFEFTPVAPGEVRLEVGYQRIVLATLPLRVR